MSELENAVHQRLKETVSLLLLGCGGLAKPRNGPYQLASGQYSPMYFDNRRLATDGSDSLIVTAYALRILKQIQQQNAIDTIAGGETAGIAPAKDLARMSGKQFIYVRKKPKGYGKNARVEGMVTKGTALLFEDLITQGKSKVQFINGLREAEYEVSHCLVIFDREQGGRKRLKEQSVTLHSLTDFSTTLKVGKASGALKQSELDEIHQYLEDPEQWSKQYEQT